MICLTSGRCYVSTRGKIKEHSNDATKEAMKFYERCLNDHNLTCENKTSKSLKARGKLYK
jgi:hypothetical protein